MVNKVTMKNPLFWMGIGLAVIVAISATILSKWIGENLLGFSRSPISAIMMAIFLGMVIANIVSLNKFLIEGLRFCSTTILRFGIVLLGIRLSLFVAGKFTLIALPFVLIAITIGLTIVGLVGKYMRLSKQLSGLIAVGTSICGATAIIAIAPQIKAKEAEVSYAIACITIFGLVAMFLYPIFSYELFPEKPVLAGLFLGTSIHETAQVAGAGMIYEAQYSTPVALDVATVTKLVRNLCMIIVIPFVGFLYSSDRKRHANKNNIRWFSMIPWFIVGFALMSAFRTLGDLAATSFGVLDQQQWGEFVSSIKNIAEQCLLVAMAAIGLTTLFSNMYQIGIKPFILGFFAALLVGGISLASIIFFADYVIKIIGF
tara:strand:+ start:496 stop:1611 length:1116 start_codon:yes stop_codon:yes gene_type:complete